MSRQLAKFPNSNEKWQNLQNAMFNYQPVRWREWQLCTPVSVVEPIRRQSYKPTLVSFVLSTRLWSGHRIGQRGDANRVLCKRGYVQSSPHELLFFIRSLGFVFLIDCTKLDFNHWIVAPFQHLAEADD